ncbi:MAG: hypothetical protein ABJF10_22695 [Chthoniobacter sp.]|uniref:hypothetical protein n=1 Tax=Chthoniobacter sp. TaxID=2510640 RepID=UPI0032A25829
MKRSRAQVEPLFTALERVGLASLVLVFFAFAMASLTAEELSWRRSSALLPGSWLGLLYTFWMRFSGAFSAAADLLAVPLWLGIAMSVWIHAFRRLRRDPLVLTRHIAWMAGALIFSMFLRLPGDIADLAGILRGPALPVDWYSYYASVSEAGGFFLRLMITLLVILFGGELSQMARERMLRAGWEAMRNKPEEMQREWRRREALVLTIRGPKVPISLAAPRFLSLMIAPFAAVLFVSRMADDIRYLEFRLPAPAMILAAAVAPERGKDRLRIDAAGRVYLNDVLTAEGPDHSCEKLMALLKGMPARQKTGVLLEVEAGVRFERMIDVVSAADRSGVRLAIEE